MAPEVIETSGKATPMWDIWSLGCTIIELLTGRPPFYGVNPFQAMLRIVKEDMPIPEDFSKVIFYWLTLIGP